MPHHKRIIQKFRPMAANQRDWCAGVAILLCLLSSGVAKTSAVPTSSATNAAAAIDSMRLSSSTSSLLLQRISRDIAASLLREESKETLAAASAETTLANLQLPQQQQPQDCSKDGKTYSNGDKLVDPETPCTVCYCQGGEILCSSVTCFYRGDCQPKYIPGRCCPEYNNCPIAVAVTNNQTTTTTTIKPEAVAVAALNPKITIKEITKPIEIRITDDNKPLAIHQMLKPTTTTTQTTTTTAAAATAVTSIPTTTTTITTTTTTTTALPPTTTTPITTTTTKSTTNAEAVSDESSALSTDNNLNTVNSNKNESLKLIASVAYPSTEHPAPQQPPASSSASEPSLDNFDEIVMVKNGNGDEKPISVFGTQGLQRVDSEAVNDSSKVNIKREYLVTTEGVAPVASHLNSTPLDDAYASELLIVDTDVTQSVGSTSQNAAEVDPETAGSDNIYQIILTTDGPRWDSNTMALLGTATEGLAPAGTMQTTLDALPTQAINDNAITTAQNKTKHSKEPKKSMTTEGPGTAHRDAHHKSSTDVMQQHVEDEDVAMPVESNPAYPSLPEDDFSLRDVNFPMSETEDAAEVDVKDESRSIVGDALKSTKHLEDNSMDGSGNDSLGDSSLTLATETDMRSSSTTEEAAVGARMPAEVQLMYSAEDTSAETAISNSTDFQLENLMKEMVENETGSGQSMEMDAMESIDAGNGSGYGAIMAKQREHTTARPRAAQQGLEIDELGTASGDGNAETPLDDPKLDAESLKVNGNQNDDAEVANHGDTLAAKAYPTQDKTLEETPTGVDAVRGRLQRLYLQRVY